VRILIFCLIISITKFISAQNVTLFEQHNGRFDYTAIGNTLNIIENGAYFECSILTSSDANLFIESNQIVRVVNLASNSSSPSLIVIALIPLVLGLEYCSSEVFLT